MQTSKQWAIELVRINAFTSLIDRIELASGRAERLQAEMSETRELHSQIGIQLSNGDKIADLGRAQQKSLQVVWFAAAELRNGLCDAHGAALHLFTSELTGGVPTEEPCDETVDVAANIRAACRARAAKLGRIPGSGCTEPIPLTLKSSTTVASPSKVPQVIDASVTATAPAADSRVQVLNHWPSGDQVAEPAGDKQIANVEVISTAAKTSSTSTGSPFGSKTVASGAPRSVHLSGYVPESLVKNVAARLSIAGSVKKVRSNRSRNWTIVSFRNLEAALAFTSGVPKDWNAKVNIEEADRRVLALDTESNKDAPEGQAGSSTPTRELFSLCVVKQDKTTDPVPAKRAKSTKPVPANVPEEPEEQYCEEEDDGQYDATQYHEHCHYHWRHGPSDSVEQQDDGEWNSGWTEDNEWYASEWFALIA